MNTLELWHSLSHSYFNHGRVSTLTDEDILLQAVHSFVSIGTERSMISKAIDPISAKKMEVPYMLGELGKSFTYGYSLVAKVLDGPKHLKGQLVHLLHPHQNYAVVKESSLSILPDGLDPRIATLASNMETAVNAIWDAQVEIGDRILIIGYGSIGALIAAIAQRLPGVRVDIKEIDDAKQKIAASIGLCTEVSTEEPYDLIFNTSGNSEMLQFAIKHTRQEGKIIELSWYANNAVSLSLGKSFHWGRKAIISSQVSSIPFRKQPKWNYSSRKKLVFSLLRELDLNHILTHSIEYKHAPEFFNSLRNRKVNDIGIIINY